ncbi:NFATC2-interacting protein-like isoform X1 [Ranitomeya imitator]|uniref:NFATC2-interacting protein-like isoform X1 n=2 Tax=Ranitomeya imitator TaxID=111125 RepID=UPI0037E7B6D6
MADICTGKQRDDDSHSSDSDVAIIVPRRAKRRRILQGNVPITATVYSNKVNSSLTLIPDNLNTLAHMEKELQKKQGCEDLESEVPVEPPLVHPAIPTYDLYDPEDEQEDDKTTPCDRVRNSSPSPPPTPKTPVRKRKKGMDKKIRKMEERLQDLGTVLSPLRSSDNDVIMLGSSPPPELIIKVRRRGKIFRINIQPTDTLERLVESVASRLEVAASQILLLRGDEELDIKETPQSLNLTVADIIDCVVHSSSRDPGSDGQSDEICLKVQGKDKQSHLSVTIGMTEPFQTLMDQYKAAMGLSKNVCFMFEGQKLTGRNTAQELGLESEDIIEAWA